MCVNLNENEIKKIIVNCDYLPKNKAGKNDRVAIVKGLEHGHTYKLGVTFVYNDWSEYNTEFTITKLLQNREWVNIKDTGEGRFGSFSLLFNSLLAGTFKKEAQEQSDRYFRLVNQMNGKVNKAEQELGKQKEITKKFKSEKEQAEREASILRGDKVLLEGQVENQLIVIEEQKREITVLKEEVKDAQSKSIENMDDIAWGGIVKIIAKGVLTGKSTKVIKEKVLKELNK